MWVITLVHHWWEELQVGWFPTWSHCLLLWALKTCWPGHLKLPWGGMRERGCPNALENICCLS